MVESDFCVIFLLDGNLVQVVVVLTMYVKSMTNKMGDDDSSDVIGATARGRRKRRTMKKTTFKQKDGKGKTSKRKTQQFDL